MVTMSAKLSHQEVGELIRACSHLGQVIGVFGCWKALRKELLGLGQERFLLGIVFLG